jgi:hypothetical protein
MAATITNHANGFDRTANARSCHTSLTLGSSRKYRIGKAQDVSKLFGP